MNQNLLASSILSLCMVSTVFGQTVFDEGSSGDASSDESMPTAITLSEGNNNIIGSVTTSTGDTRDYYTFTIATGFELIAINVVSYDDPAVNGSNDGNRGFHHIDAGTSSVIPGAGTSSSLLGGEHIDGSDAGTNVLPAFAAASTAGAGFTAPIGAGAYTYLIQQTGSQVSEYEIQFVVAAEGTTPMIDPVDDTALKASLTRRVSRLKKKIKRLKKRRNSNSRKKVAKLRKSLKRTQAQLRGL